MGCLTYFIAFVWLFNGVYCKILGRVPRHRLIIEEILGEGNSGTMTRLIGWAEVAMAIWILSGLWPGINAAAQIIVILAMNILEYFKARRLLLWGGYNLLFALLFIALIVYNAYLMP